MSGNAKAPRERHAGAALQARDLAPQLLDARWRVFLQVAAAGSLSKASLVLDMPQSMVSRHIAQLEAECRERLFRRTGRGVQLTELGQRLLPGVARLAADADSLGDDIRSVGSRPVGEVMVGLLPSAVRAYAGPLFSAVRAEHPGVRLHLVEGASAQLEEQLADGRLDMAMVLRESDLAAPHEPVLARLALQLVGRRGDAPVSRPEVPLAALQGLPLVVPSRPHALRARLDWLVAEHGLALQVAVEVDSVGLQYEVVAAGGGFAIASVMPGPFDARLSAARIVEPVLHRLVVLGESTRRPATRATRAVRKLVCDVVGAREATPQEVDQGGQAGHPRGA